MKLKDKLHIEWLYNELPGLTKEGIVSAAAAEGIRKHYGTVEKGSRTNLALTLLSIVGALLIGSGILILIGHNWDTLPNYSRALLALLPLAGAQILGGYALHAKRDSRKWTESCAVLIMMLCGASIAVVGQTYHLGGTTHQFLFTWMALSIPLIYLFRATVTSLLCHAGIGAFLVLVSRRYDVIDQQGLYLILFLVLLAAIAPFSLKRFSEDRYSVSSVLLSVAAMGVLIIAADKYAYYAINELLKAEISRIDRIIFLLYSMVFALFYLAGRLIAPKAPSVWQQPMQAAGSVVVMLIAYLHAFTSRWIYNTDVSLPWGIIMGLLLVFLLASAPLIYAAFRRDREVPAPVVLVPLLIIAGFALNEAFDSAYPGIVVVNIFIFAIGIATFLMGVRQMNMRRINAGMFLVALMIVSHFFATDVGFIVKGLVFVFTGAAFVAANLILLKKKRAS